MDSKFIAFTKAAKLGSFKEAAEELGYTQAGVSYMISSLEKEMGVTLFHRGRTGAQLTEEGRTLLPWVLDIVNDESALEVKLREMRNLEIGDVRIASFASVAIHWLPDVFVRFMEDHPHIKLDVTCFEEQDEMEDAVQNGEFDCCFLIEPSKTTRSPTRSSSPPKPWRRSPTSRCATIPTPKWTPSSSATAWCPTCASRWTTIMRSWAW